MISIEDAIQIIKKHSTVQPKSTIKTIEKACGYFLAEDIYSPIDIPSFNQSAMDGYALHYHDQPTYKVIGEVKAGDSWNPKLDKGECIRIFTGAAVPDDANTVVMQEKVSVDNDLIKLEATITEGKNIRYRGEQLQKNEIALSKGTKITPAAVGLLYSLGINEISVFKKPSIVIISTGNELLQINDSLSHGKIYESNSKMLLSCLYSLKFYDVTTYVIKDSYHEILKSIKTNIDSCDILITTGGISVGKYDFIRSVLDEIGVDVLFFKIDQKPGKPILYSKKNGTQIFALPGNPAAALICFYMYVYVALQNFMGKSITELPKIKAQLTHNFSKKGDKPQFLKAIYKDGKVEILDGQSSAMLQTFAVSNALIYIPKQIKEIKKDDLVEVIVLPV